MDQGSQPIQELAAQLVSLHPMQTEQGCNFQNACAIFEQIQTSLSVFTGSGGYASLLQRSLVLAQTHEPLLTVLEMNSNGKLILKQNEQTEVADTECEKATVFLVGQFLGLLENFIGTELTVNLVQNAWPKVDFKSSENPAKEKS